MPMKIINGPPGMGGAKIYLEKNGFSEGHKLGKLLGHDHNQILVNKFGSYDPLWTP